MTALMKAGLDRTKPACQPNEPDLNLPIGVVALRVGYGLS